MSLSSCEAWEAVRGKPSRMKDASGCSDHLYSVSRGGETDTMSSCGRDGVLAVETELTVIDCAPPFGMSQPRVVRALRIRRRIIESGTRAPRFMRDPAWVPGVVARH